MHYITSKCCIKLLINCMKDSRGIPKLTRKTCGTSVQVLQVCFVLLSVKVTMPIMRTKTLLCSCCYFCFISCVMFVVNYYICIEGWDSAVGIATRYGLDGPGIECRWGRELPHTSRPALGPNHPPVQWGPGHSGG